MSVDLLPGVSFILRARNEEAYLQQNLESLLGLTIPHEIVVILHLCDDGSERIAEEARLAGQPIRIFKYDTPVSRAGYETLVTPNSHPNSFVNFCRFSFSKRLYTWVFKWDGDFMATPELIEYLNNDFPLHDKEPCSINIPCKLGDAYNNEYYLTNAYCDIGKYCFWEVMLYPHVTKKVQITQAIHSIPVSTVKPYWRSPPWFIGVDKELEDKYVYLVYKFGAEPRGLARASNPECDSFFHSIIANSKDLEMHGIHVHH